MPELIDLQRHRTAKVFRKMHSRLVEMAKKAPNDENIRRRLQQIEADIQKYEASVRSQV